MFNKDDIKCVLVDLDDTLIATSWRVQPAFILKACYNLRARCRPFRTFKALAAAHLVKKHHAHVKELNHDRFIRAFATHTKLDTPACETIFRDNLPVILSQCEHFFAPIPEAQQFLRDMKARVPLVLATNPVLNEACARLRISWAGFDYEDFAHVTHSQNTHYCKPSNAYYEELIERVSSLGLSKEQCLFIGNDPKNDAAAIHSGLTTILVNRKPHYDFKRLRAPTTHCAGLYQASWSTIALHFGLQR